MTGRWGRARGASFGGLGREAVSKPILQADAQTTAFETYKIYALLHRSKLQFLAKVGIPFERI